MMMMMMAMMMMIVMMVMMRMMVVHLRGVSRAFVVRKLLVGAQTAHSQRIHTRENRGCC
jgi:hypothetical protein